MAITFVLDIKGGTVGQLDDAAKRLGVGPDSVPEGQIAHVEAATADGVRVIDVWDSEEAFGRFMEERLAPLMAEGIIPQLDPPPMLQVHRVFVAPIGAAR